jgi:hypothetical protein
MLQNSRFNVQKKDKRSIIVVRKNGYSENQYVVGSDGKIKSVSKPYEGKKHDFDIYNSMFKFLVIDFWARTQQEQYLCERAGVDSNLPINLPPYVFEMASAENIFYHSSHFFKLPPGSRSCSKDLIHSIKTSIWPFVVGYLR